MSLPRSATTIVWVLEHGTLSVTSCASEFAQLYFEIKIFCKSISFGMFNIKAFYSFLSSKAMVWTRHHWRCKFFAISEVASSALPSLQRLSTYFLKIIKDKEALWKINQRIFFECYLDRNVVTTLQQKQPILAS